MIGLDRYGGFKVQDWNNNWGVDQSCPSSVRCWELCETIEKSKAESVLRNGVESEWVTILVHLR